MRRMRIYFDCALCDTHWPSFFRNLLAIAAGRDSGGGFLVPYRLCTSGFAESRVDDAWLTVMHGGARMTDVGVEDARVDTRVDTHVTHIDSTHVDSERNGKPSREQFSVGPYQVQHLPTGAKFGAYPGENDLCYINWGRLSERYVAQDYCEELKKIASELLRERPKY